MTSKTATRLKFKMMSVKCSSGSHVTLAPGKQKREHHKFQASQGYVVRP